MLSATCTASKSGACARLSWQDTSPSETTPATSSCSARSIRYCPCLSSCGARRAIQGDGGNGITREERRNGHAWARTTAKGAHDKSQPPVAFGGLRRLSTPRAHQNESSSESPLHRFSVLIPLPPMNSATRALRPPKIRGSISAMQDFEKLGLFYLGRTYDTDAHKTTDDLVLYDSRDLVTHAVCVGMTGSGKTGLCLSLIEEAAIDGVPVIAIDPKGDLGNVLLTFPSLAGADFRPWIDEDEARRASVSPDAFAA